MQKAPTSSSKTARNNPHFPKNPHQLHKSLEKACKMTSLSMLQVDFRHYMAGTFNPNIAIMNATMADIPMLTSYVPARWKKGLNVMLQKQAGNINVEKLQIIVLFEADFNRNKKWMGRAIIFTAEKFNALAPKQYGSRKGKVANVQSLNKQLFYNTIRFKRQLAALCCNDAKSCYNRIILLIATLAMCQLGGNIIG